MVFFSSFFQKKVLYQPMIKISVLTDISVLEIYGYIGYIGDISVDIFT